MGTIHDVGYFDQGMRGAPGGFGTTAGIAVAGSFIQILDACLVNGFNVQAVTSIVVLDGVATVTTTNADPGFRDHQRVRVEGASPPELNGDWKIAILGGNTFTFPTTAPNGSATGTITVKTAPLGWTKEFSATNVAVYRPKSGLRHFFRVDDIYSSACGVRGYEVMTGSGDSGTQPFPTPVQLSSGVNWHKNGSNGSNTWFQQWTVIGDGHCVYIVYSPDDHLGVQQSHADYNFYGFGEMITYVPGDSGNSFVIGDDSNNVASYHWPYCYFCGSAFPGYISSRHYSGMYMSRRYSQELGATVRFKISGSGLMEGWGSSAKGPERTPYPNQADLGVLFHTPIHVQEEATNCIRGELPGPYQFLHSYASSRLGEICTVNGRKILLTRAYDNNSPESAGTGKSGIMGWDITGPWR